MLFAAEMFAGLQAYGYVGIIAYMILTGCGLPTPEEVAIIGAGVVVFEFATATPERNLQAIGAQRHAQTSDFSCASDAGLAEER